MDLLGGEGGASFISSHKQHNRELEICNRTLLLCFCDVVLISDEHEPPGAGGGAVFIDFVFSSES